MPGSLSIKVTTNGNNVTNGVAERLFVFIQSCSTFVAVFIVTCAGKLTVISICVGPVSIVVTGVA
ncbi:hypothetical protein ColLi_11228 [Colletotrichum liriopes]|uniref:Uncharacterized protein n=1 Tax=Colletotrichum liriopes TaxID=708192 RepID=A0AA37LWW6_9PEZI|nr:hypothetical protein ColLi_11228 [Colletotrichum liriopes]